MTTILTIEHIPGFISDVKQYLKSEFDLTPDLQTVSISSLPRNEAGYVTDHLQGLVITDYWGIKASDKVKRVADVAVIADVGDIVASQFIKPKVWFTDDITVAKRWLAKYDTFKIVACDFETKDLTLPTFNPLSMITIGWNLLKSTVFVFPNNTIRDLLLDWLVTTNTTQVWHNALFDVKHIHYHTGKFPKHIEDSQLLAAVYNNNVDTLKRKSGLKQISGPLYGDWAGTKSTFDLYDTELNDTVTYLKYIGPNPNWQQYNLALIYYCGIDQCATKYAWEKYAIEPCHPAEWVFPTSEPRHNTEQFNQRYYYEHILKPAIPLIIEMMNNGQEIDLSIVKKLESEVKAYNTKLMTQIEAIPCVIEFQSKVDSERIEKFLTPVRKAMKLPKYAGYKNNVAMRTYVVNYFDSTSHSAIKANLLQELNSPICKLLMDKQFQHPAIVSASNAYEVSECFRQNLKANRIDKLEHPEKHVRVGFNPFNYSQLTQMWQAFGLVSDTISKETGQPSYESNVLKRLVHEATGDVQTVIKLYLEIAQSKNMITQYLPKYYGSTVNGRLHYSLKLMGTFTGRLSGKAGGIGVADEAKHMMGANGVTQPVGHRVYGKTVKSMFIAPPGRILAAVDYNGLENHINACLTKDTTTIKLLSPDTESGLMWDMHTLHSTIFFKEQWEKLIGQSFENTIQFNKLCYDLTNSDKEASNLRSDSKGCTFKLAYGGFPDVAKGGTITQEIFDRYHGELYPGVTTFKEEYVIPTIQKNKSLHLNWGLQLATSNPRGDLLPMNNANFQGYSDLTMISGTKFRDKYLADGNVHNISGLNIIHDALYYELDNTPEAIKYINDNLIACMTPDFLINQTVHLRAELDIGFNQRDMVTLSNNASIEEITTKLKDL